MSCDLVRRGVGGLSLWTEGLLPMAHLLDATWWFDRQTIESFRATTSQLPPEATIAFLGTPSLFLDTSQHSAFRTTLLIDKDETIRACLPEQLRRRFRSCDLRGDLPDHLGADLVIADPPWYLEEMMSFLAAGQAVAKIGSEVQVCLPPKGIRPGIEQERQTLFSWAGKGGLRLVALLEEKLHYEASPFEKNVLRATGQDPEEEPRSGDLAIFAVDSAEGLTPVGLGTNSRWTDITMLETRWRVRQGSAGSGRAIELIALGFADDVFPSCSRRHTDHNRPDVWTSGNRVFCCENPQGFLNLLRSLKGDTISRIAECAESLYPGRATSEAKTAAQILALIDVEQREVEALKRCLSGKGT